MSRVVPDAELDDAGMQQAKALAQGPAQVMGLAKLIMARSFESNLGDLFLMEGMGQSLAQSSAEFQEGLSALMEKRPADFSNAGRKPGKS